jgi:hypothetical protein
MIGHIDKHFTKLGAMFDDFSKLLRDHAAVDFSIEPRGEAIRAELEKHIKFIEEKAGALRNLLLVDLTQEDESLLANEYSFIDAEGRSQISSTTSRRSPSESGAPRNPHMVQPSATQNLSLSQSSMKLPDYRI